MSVGMESRIGGRREFAVYSIMASEGSIANSLLPQTLQPVCKVFKSLGTVLAKKR